MTLKVHFKRLLPFMLLGVLCAPLGCGGCDDDPVDRVATVTIDSVDPIGGYPNVEATVSFTIEPGDNTNTDDMEWLVAFGDGTTTAGTGVEGSASHAYELSGEYDIEVFAKFEGETAGEATTTYRVYAPTDLEIDETRGAPANVQTGDDLTVSFIVRNNTSAELFTPYTVAAYLSESPSVTRDDIEDLPKIGEQTVEPDAEGEVIIEPGGERSSSATFTIPEMIEGGDYYVVTLLDPDEQIADTDLENNLDTASSVIRLENVNELLPDVAVEDLVVAPDRAFPTLNTVTRGLLLVNNGSEDAFGVVLETYLSIGDDELDEEDDLLIDTSDPVDLVGQDEKEIIPESFDLLENEIVPQMGQELQVWVIVRAVPESGTMESDDTNNQIVSMEPIIVTDEPVEGPDIVAKEFSVSPDSTFLNGSLEVSALIANEGTVDVGSFFCGIYLGDSPRVDTENDPRLDNINFPALASGAEEDIDGHEIIVPGLYEPGTYYLYIACDPLNALMEPFRSNNTKVYLTPITITDEADVDLFVETLTVPQTVDEGDMMTVTARVCVAGSNPSGTTKAELYRTAGNQVDFMAEPFIDFEVPNITPGNCQEIDIEFEAACDDFQETYSFGVVVDADSRLPERNETNNNKAGDNPLTVSGQFCSCDEDGFEENDDAVSAVNLTEGLTSAAICTFGDCDYFRVHLEQNDSLIVTNDFVTEKGELVTTLFDSSGLQVLETDSSPDTQQVGTFLVPQEADYIFRVCGADGMTRNFYDLDVDIIPQSSGVDVLPRSVEIPAGDSFSIGASFDVDARIYNLGMNEATSFDAQVVVSSNDVIGDGDDRIMNTVGAGPVPGGSFRDITVPITIPTTLMDGDYYIGVILDPPPSPQLTTETDTTNNTARSRKFEVRTICFDPLEPNDSFSDATTITEQSYSNLIACTDGADYYAICPGDAKKFDITTNFDDDMGDIDVELYDQQFQLIDSSANTQTDVEQVSVDYVNGPQCYYAKVFLVTLQDDLETTYSMDVNIDDVDPSLVCDSAFEPNDTFASSSSLIAALGQSFNMDRCPVADTDFYHVNLTAGQTVSFSATLDPATQPGTLRIQLYKPNQTPGPNKETAPGVPTAEIEDYVAPQSGRYFVQVTVSGNSRNVTYALGASGLGGIDLAVENLIIGPGSYQGGDELRFGFDLANLRADDAIGPMYDVYLGTSQAHDPNADQLLGTFMAPDVSGNTTEAVADKATIPTTVTAGATLYLHVVVDPNDNLADDNESNDIGTVPVQIAP